MPDNAFDDFDDKRNEFLYEMYEAMDLNVYIAVSIVLTGKSDEDCNSLMTASEWPTGQFALCQGIVDYRIQVICRTCGPRTFLVCRGCLDLLIDPTRREDKANCPDLRDFDDRVFCTERSDRHEVVAVMDVAIPTWDDEADEPV